MRRLLGALALLCAAAAPVSAQTDDETAVADAPAAETAPAIDTAGLAARIIADAQADDIFVPVVNENFVIVRHSASGLVCRLPPENANRIALFPQAARGEDVACESIRGGEVIRLYATRYSFETTLDQQLAGATDAIRNHFYSVHPLPEPSAANPPANLPANLSARFAAADQQGARFYTRVSVALVNGWTLKLRYTAPARNQRDIDRAERRAEGVWLYALRNAARRRPS